MRRSDCEYDLGGAKMFHLCTRCVYKSDANGTLSKTPRYEDPGDVSTSLELLSFLKLLYPRL